MYEVLADFLGTFPQEIKFVVPITFMLICILLIYGLFIAPWIDIDEI